SEPFASLRVNAARNLRGSRTTPRAARGDHAGWSQGIGSIRVIPVAHDPIHVLRGSGRGERLVERLLAARQADRRRE
ncbi:MAG: hypothetical protein ACP5MJ_16635, partial [Roseiflexus sp.]